jgi:hypothetical protein
MAKSVPRHYVPRSLSRKDTRKQKRELAKSRKLYKRGKYHTRKRLDSYKSKPSKYSAAVERIYGLPRKSITMKALSRKSGCSMRSLERIVRKGIGAYYSSGSRPNQTGHSWGYARLFSALTGGPAAKVDRHILEEGCKPGSKARRLARKPTPRTKRGKVEI